MNRDDHRSPGAPSGPEGRSSGQPGASSGDRTPNAGGGLLPTLSLPKGGGAIRGIDEKLAVNPATGTGSLRVPLGLSPGRADFGPDLELAYDSGSGNGPFGLGWDLSLPSITRKTDKGLPQYRDAEESDVFILSGAEDLVPELAESGGSWQLPDLPPRTVDGVAYQVRRYRPRIEGLFARIERWTNRQTGETHWRSITRDNVTTLYGKDNNSRIFDPADPDPDHPRRVFSWLISASWDDKGNAIVYQYKEEDSDGVDNSQAHERNRTAAGRSANRYLKRIRYGNRVSRLIEPDLSEAEWMFEAVLDYGEHHPDDPKPNDPGEWLCRHDPFSSYRAGFEVRTYRLCQRVLMFHHFPDEDVGQDCLVRSTDFVYRDLRGEEDDLRKGHPVASFIASVTQSGYKRQAEGGYLKKSLPPLDLEYSLAEIDEEVRELDAESLENLPAGLDGSTWRFVDLDGEGVSGVLAEQAGAWFYKPNRGGGRFGPLEKVAAIPAPVGAGSGAQQLLDLAGDGQLDLVELGGATPGFYERTADQRWESFKPFASLPNLRWDEPNLRFVDLNGDGHADVLVTEDEVFTWYPSLAEEGFAPAEHVRQALDEERGPRLVFADGTQSIYLADLSGDGLSDLARIRNGEVCYWPNLGYGRFGAKVTMDDGPHFDAPDLFDQRRLRLADVDGSGTADLLYLGHDGVDVYCNESGNRWSAARRLRSFPPVDNVSSVTAVDLLGNGTACLVWSSPLPGDRRRPLRYVDLMGGRKPHLLIASRNNLGAETRVHYAPSTRFYLADKAAGRPWISRLPFPVHVVERVETWDHVSRNRFVTRYAYHHGYFDGEEREFRGFAMVEQWDTEEMAALTAGGTLPEATNVDEASHVPPVLTKTWFHTGAFIEGRRISRQLEDEYYREGDPSAGEQLKLDAMLLDDTVVPSELSVDTTAPVELSVEEAREACRALKGSILRQEVYALDGTEEEDRPYTVSERNFTVEWLQPRGENRHAVFFAHPRETIDFHYERKLFDVGNRKLADPRVTHAMTLDVDEYGNVLRSVAIGYGRRHDAPDPVSPRGEPLLTPQGEPVFTAEDREKQQKILITLTENQYTYPVPKKPGLVKNDYRTPAPCESRTYEILKVEPSSSQPDVTNLFRFEEMKDTLAVFADGKHDALYEDLHGTNVEEDPPYRRLIERVRTLYRRDDLDGLLDFRELDPMALPGEGYKLAFTPGLLSEVFERPHDPQPAEGEPPPENLLPEPERANVLGSTGPDGGGYVDLDGDEHWWIPSGRVFYSAEPDSAVEERGDARQHFFLPRRFRDPFGHDATVAYDTHDLLVQETCDAVGNLATAGERDAEGNLVKQGNDYRVLQPWLMMGPNRNRSAVAFDALGMVAGTALMGKPEPAAPEGDSLAGFEANLTESQVDGFYAAADPHLPAPDLLRGATTRIVYDRDRFRRTRDAHPDDPEQWLPVYAATLARATHLRDPLPTEGLKIQISFSYSDGFGREIQKKMQAEPGPLDLADPDSPDVDPRWVGSGWTIFNNKGRPVRQYKPFFSATHRFEFAKVVGVSPILFYDPVGRVIATLHPNHTWEKVVFDPWRQETWDINDTILLDPTSDPDVGDFFSRLPAGDYLPTWHTLRTDDSMALARWPDADPDTAELIPENKEIRRQEKSAAQKTEAHAGTSAVAYLDSLGRTILTIADNGSAGKYPTRVDLDIEGNTRAVIDARGNTVMRYAYSMVEPEEEDEEAEEGEDEEGEDEAEQADSHLIYQWSMDGGERWLVYNVTGNPIRRWDSRGFTHRMEHDELQRPTHLWVQEGAGAEWLAELTVHGEGHPASQALNLRGQVFRQYDGAGVLSSEAIDFKGNQLRGRRRLAGRYESAVDWSTVQGSLPPKGANGALDLEAIDAAADPLLEAEIFESRTRYDALDRPVQQISPHHVTVHEPPVLPNVIQPRYNEAGLLNSIDLWLRRDTVPDELLAADTADQHVVRNIDYDAKGQRVLIAFGNGVRTEYTYDPETLHLSHLLTIRSKAGDCPDKPDPEWPGCQAQNLRYTYDPTGNIAHIRDDAQQTIFFRNQRVEPSSEYTYDAVYRLIEATGREHLGQNSDGELNPPRRPSDTDVPRVNLLQPGDGRAMGRYTETYEYDAVGNILVMIHRAQGSNGWTPHRSSGWTRCYQYADDSNRLLNTVGHDEIVDSCGSHYAAESPDSDQYLYDKHGSMTTMPHLELMGWDFEDQLHVTKRGTTRGYYYYDAEGERVRKVAAKNNGNLIEERLYLGGFELFRSSNRSGLVLERETLHVMDDEQRIAMVETKTYNEGAMVHAPAYRVRYQIGNHLGSVSLELDEAGAVISYEEYHPYGTTAYRAGRSGVEASLKRYRYTGKERDEETGLYYHGARYYAPWLGRWVTCDPWGTVDGFNLYAYVTQNPINRLDHNGMGGEEADQNRKKVSRQARNRTRGFRMYLRKMKSHGLSLSDIYHGVVDFIYTGTGASSAYQLVWKRKWRGSREHSELMQGKNFFSATPPEKGTSRLEGAVGVATSVLQGRLSAAMLNRIQARIPQSNVGPPTPATQARPRMPRTPLVASRTSQSTERVRLIEALKSVVERENQRLAAAIKKKDVTFLQKLGISQSRIDILINKRRTHAAQYGNVLERMVAQSVRLDPTLNRHFRYVANKLNAVVYKGKPDWAGAGVLRGIWIDLTTLRQKAKHLARHYGKTVLILTYSRR